MHVIIFIIIKSFYYSNKKSAKFNKSELMWCFSFAFIFKEDHSCSGYSPTLSVAVDALPGEEGETNLRKMIYIPKPV